MRIVCPVWDNEMARHNGTPRKRDVMRSLQELQGKAALALGYPQLVEVAETSTPTAAYERALDMHFGEEIARSCRFLAVIARDYGKDAIKQSVQSREEADLDRHFRELIVPGIRVLEKVAGDRLMIVKPEDRGLSLIEYLAGTKPCSIGLGLKLGEYEIALKWQIRKRDPDAAIDFESQLTVVASDGTVLINEAGSLMYSDRTPPNGVELRWRFYHYLRENLFSLSGWPRKSALLLIIEDLAKRGEKVAPRLYSAFDHLELYHYKRYGLVDRLTVRTDEVRKAAVASGVSARALVFLDFEVAEAIREAERSHRWMDKSRSLLDKLRDSKGRMVGVNVVPGPKAARTYTFLLHCDGFVSGRWFELLAEKGYCGSVVITFFNVDSGMQVAETGQCDAFLLDQHGWSPKNDVLDEAQKAMENAQAALGVTSVPVLPRHVHEAGISREWNQTCGGLDKFLDEHFPLK